MAWTNPDGLLVRSGQDWIKSKNAKNRPGTLSTMGAYKQIEIDVDFAKLTAGAVNYTADPGNTGTNTGFYAGDVSLPEQATPTQVLFVSNETAVGGTAFIVGTFLRDGTAVDADGLISATEGVVANMTVGKRIYGAGAQVAVTAGTAGVNAARTYIGITPTGTFTAGKGRLIISYIDPLPAIAS